MKTLTIKTAQNTIHIANGKVMQVRDNKTGRFVAIKKFANILNRLFILANNAITAIETNKGFYFTPATKLAVNLFDNAKKFATALLGDVRLYTKRNYCVSGLSMHTMHLHIA